MQRAITQTLQPDPQNALLGSTRELTTPKATARRGAREARQPGPDGAEGARARQARRPPHVWVLPGRADAGSRSIISLALALWLSTASFMKFC